MEVSHYCVLSSKDYPGCPGAVTEVCWTPDGCAMAATWYKGGIGLWSTFGTLLMCTLGWDYGLNVDLERFNPLLIRSMVCNTTFLVIFSLHYLSSLFIDSISIDMINTTAIIISPTTPPYSQYILKIIPYIQRFSASKNKIKLFKEWACEGYQLWMVREQSVLDSEDENTSNSSTTYNVIQLDFVKSALTVNPCMVSILHILTCLLNLLLLHIMAKHL